MYNLYHEFEFFIIIHSSLELIYLNYIIILLFLLAFTGSHKCPDLKNMENIDFSTCT